MKKLLVSACLLGEPLRYDGDDNAGQEQGDRDDVGDGEYQHGCNLLYTC